MSVVVVAIAAKAPADTEHQMLQIVAEASGLNGTTRGTATIHPVIASMSMRMRT
jgi:hypothetical protein